MRSSQYQSVHICDSNTQDVIPPNQTCLPESLTAATLWDWSSSQSSSSSHGTLPTMTGRSGSRTAQPGSRTPRQQDTSRQPSASLHPAERRSAIDTHNLWSQNNTAGQESQVATVRGRQAGGAKDITSGWPTNIVKSIRTRSKQAIKNNR